MAAIKHFFSLMIFLVVHKKPKKYVINYFIQSFFWVFLNTVFLFWTEQNEKNDVLQINYLIFFLISKPHFWTKINQPIWILINFFNTKIMFVRFCRMRSNFVECVWIKIALFVISNSLSIFSLPLLLSYTYFYSLFFSFLSLTKISNSI